MAGIDLTVPAPGMPGPNVIGATGGSGTRVVARIVRHGGMFIGTNANGTTTVNLVEPAQVYGDRVTQIDMRFAKILRFGRTRTDIGVDLLNLLNTNDAAGYEQTFDYATRGASWLRPTSIVPPRFARVNVTLNF